MVKIYEPLIQLHHCFLGAQFDTLTVKKVKTKCGENYIVKSTYVIMKCLAPHIRCESTLAKFLTILPNHNYAVSTLVTNQKRILMPTITIMLFHTHFIWM